MQAAAPLDEEYFAPTTRVTGLTYPNPPNCTCQVVMGVQQTSTTGPDHAQPTTSPVPSAVDGSVTLQIENLADFAYEVRRLPFQDCQPGWQIWSDLILEL